MQHEDSGARYMDIESTLSSLGLVSNQGLSARIQVKELWKVVGRDEGECSSKKSAGEIRRRVKCV
jgi:hypothetical protein